MRLRQLKRLAFVLPVAQVVTATLLLDWGHRLRLGLGPHPAVFYTPTVTQICYGISAPAVLLRLGSLLLRLNQTPPSIGHFGMDDLLFLVGVALVWYFVGRDLDSRKRQEPPPGISASGLATNVLLIVVGAALFCLSVGGMVVNSTENMKGQVVEVVFFIGWALVLMISSAVRIAIGFRERTHGSKHLQGHNTPR